MNEEKLLGLVTFMCILIAIVLGSFFVYHMNMAMNNTTTNESHKKEDMQELLRREKDYLEYKIDQTKKWKNKELMAPLRIEGVEMPLE